ncbi:MAG: toxin-activating lysine-acyltransferase [Hydrogenophaga sp.]|uniref:toxin-activating lysine-acyltransferase n=1 Tax=Hydrogenophaga sp. TaxID=1904254 RepID=UPI0035B110D7|nr:toxin-activating lysine-acyltransferase [Hydrogenophaga sp.]
MKQEAPTSMTPEQAQEILAFAKDQAHQMFQKLPTLGPVVWLMMQQTHTRHTLISELEWRVVPALMQEQAKLYMRGDTPLAYVSWARMSNEAAQRYRLPPHQLTYQDWQSGDQIWLIDVVAPFGGVPKLMQELREKVFKGQVVHQLAPTPTDASRVLTWPAA